MGREGLLAVVHEAAIQLAAGDSGVPDERGLVGVVPVAERELTVWEICRACALQMVNGVRCYEHNPTPEQRAAGVGLSPVPVKRGRGKRGSRAARSPTSK